MKLGMGGGVMTRQELTQLYLDSGWEIWEDGARIVRFRKGRFIGSIAELRPDDWRCTSLVDTDRDQEAGL
jgi:hypothetical protein